MLINMAPIGSSMNHAGLAHGPRVPALVSAATLSLYTNLMWPYRSEGLLRIATSKATIES